MNNKVIAGVVIVVCILICVFAECVEAQELHSVMMKYSSTQDLADKTVKFINEVVYITTVAEENVLQEKNKHYRTLAYQPLKMKDAEIKTIIEPVEVNPIVIIDTTLGEAIIYYYEERK